ncbi:MAG: hypothetical protein M3044_11505 [Thermoproteota archaeon]|jgi:hypothetical protein|nr:hypothetical protein [Thermoproteota archaeon]
MGVPNPLNIHDPANPSSPLGQIILFGGGDVGGGGGAFGPGLVCAKAIGSNDIATGAAVNANAATIITIISNVVLIYIIDMMPKMIKLSVMHKNRLDYLTSIRTGGHFGLQLPLKETVSWLAVTLQEQLPELETLLEVVPCEEPDTLQELAFAARIPVGGAKACL